MGVVLERGGSNLGWYRLNHGLGLAPPGSGGNCREQFGIFRRYHEPGVRAATQDILDRLRVNQCWLRSNFYGWLNGDGGTLVDVRSGAVTGQNLNNLVAFLQDIRDRDFKLNFGYFWIGDIAPVEWNVWEAGRYNTLYSVIKQLQPIIHSFNWPEYHVDLANEAQAASNQHPVLRQFGWRVYQDFVDDFGPGLTGGVSVGFGLGNPGLSRYDIQFQDQANTVHGVAPILDIHGYFPFSETGTNWLKLLENRMIANGDNRNIRISETFYSSHTAHVNGMLNQIAALDRDVEHIIQWGLAETNHCDDVEIVDTTLFTYGGEPCETTGVDCGNSEWG